MESCKLSDTCSSNICPRDAEIHLRTWRIDEDICPLHMYRDLPYIRRQRQLNKFRPKALLNRDEPITFDYLVKTAPKKRNLSPEHRAKLLAASKRHQFGKKGLSENREIQLTCSRMINDMGCALPGKVRGTTDVFSHVKQEDPGVTKLVEYSTCLDKSCKS
jgi:hypothetical protein